MGLCSGGSLASRTRTTKGAKCYSPPVRREPASCSGFNLLLIAAYSYIVNPDLYGQAALPGIPASRRRKAPPGSFSSAHRLCISKIAPNQRPAFARQRPLTEVHRPCRRLAVDVGGGSESDPKRTCSQGGLVNSRSAFLPCDGYCHSLSPLRRLSIASEGLRLGGAALGRAINRTRRPGR